MPFVQCVCGRKFYLGQKDYNSTILTFPQFCSVACLINYIKDSFFIERDFFYRPNKGFYEGDSVYCKELDLYFRSNYELLVALLFKKHNISYQYEPFLLFEGKNRYVPDFYLPDKDLFVEVKGLWRNGAKKKLRLWQERINLILIPWYLKGEIKSEVSRS